MSKGLIVDVFALWSVHQSNRHAALEFGQYLSDRLGLHLDHLGKAQKNMLTCQKHLTAVPPKCLAMCVATRELCPFVVASRNYQLSCIRRVACSIEAAGRSGR